MFMNKVAPWSYQFLPGGSAVSAKTWILDWNVSSHLVNVYSGVR